MAVHEQNKTMFESRVHIRAYHFNTKVVHSCRSAPISMVIDIYDNFYVHIWACCGCRFWVFKLAKKSTHRLNLLLLTARNIISKHFRLKLPKPLP